MVIFNLGVVVGGADVVDGAVVGGVDVDGRVVGVGVGVFVGVGDGVVVLGEGVMVFRAVSVKVSV